MSADVPAAVEGDLSRIKGTIRHARASRNKIKATIAVTIKLVCIKERALLPESRNLN
jgi:hypothetical protein